MDITRCFGAGVPENQQSQADAQQCPPESASSESSASFTEKQNKRERAGGGGRGEQTEKDTWPHLQEGQVQPGMQWHHRRWWMWRLGLASAKCCRPGYRVEEGRTRRTEWKGVRKNKKDRMLHIIYVLKGSRVGSFAYSVHVRAWQRTLSMFQRKCRELLIGQSCRYRPIVLHVCRTADPTYKEREKEIGDGFYYTTRTWMRVVYCTWREREQRGLKLWHLHQSCRHCE